MNEKTLRVLEYSKIIEKLTDKTESSLGEEIALKLSPSLNYEEVKYLQDETDEAVSLLLKRGSPPLGGIHDVLSEVKRAEIGGILSPGGLLRVADTIRAARKIKGFLKQEKDENNSSYPILESLIGDLNSYREIEDNIFNAIVSEEEISDNASSNLRNIRKQIQIKNDNIRTKLNSIINSSTNKKYLQDAIITIRSERYVVPVKQEYRSIFPGLIHDQSSSGATLFIEPMAIVNLNNELKELKLNEKKEIEKILTELSEMVGEENEGIRSNQKILSQIDFIFAKGKLSLDMNGSKPNINNRGYINIKKGRHPLLGVKDVVPTDIYLGDNFTTLLITGPNTGGKTVTLKTVGLFTLMMQSGLQVPVEHGTEMAVFENIFADIGDEQSIEQSLSTFSSHMTNIVDILNNLDDNSLVLFDELGAGTDPTEGAALAMSILDYLYNRKIRTVATTHYSELKVYALTTEGIENASVEFNVETLSPTYRLLIGVPGKSNAFEISKRLGLQDFIIDSAKEFISKENIAFEDVLASIEKDRIETEKNREEANRLRREVNQLKEELEEKTLKIENNREKILREAREEARNVLLKARAESEEILNELKEVSIEIEKEQSRRLQEAKEKLKGNIDNIEGDLSEQILSKKSAKPLASVDIGENVKILSLNQTGTVLSAPDENGNVLVQVGIMKITVPLDTIEKSKKESKVQTKGSAKSVIKSKSVNVKSDLDLRGQNLEEAMLEVDKFLDDAYLAGLKVVNIIHGKGTGILREGIGQLLKRHRHVKASRLGNYGEGGTGVTVVEIK
ncbi:DNA mismatch repair protein MutS [Gottschalkia acidurici 9a]|uniref:Endonuclease MutS2 n=1 Tax=Gottschalkia acidurici (strain ATCC 7906 / DSM 604 / BCRC 14475 / CIP 104303 / KCTC 5404 / NCIMB 10678 / 9a) TaxID=1128398 RepID=K0AXP0_GOTA9|nr:endonuclease MutS2 [Gottschalkia acidurici]AFS77934.1 DNA mismatch repair protein MutS [Gottschalkia acidurici 9a]